jgi:hypothetical protein
MNFTFDESTHTYTLENGVVLPSVTTVLKAEGYYGDAVKYFTEFSRDRGTYVHKIVQYHLEGCLDVDSIDAALMGYYEAWLKFECESTFKPTIIETSMVSDRIGFAGTPDLIGTFSNHESIIDIKSGIVGPVVGLQTAAYEILYSKRAKRFSLQLKSNGNYSLMEYTNRQDSGIFAAALAGWHWKKNNKIKGECYGNN